MFLNSSSRPAFNASSGNFPFCAVPSWLRSTDGVSHKTSLTAAMRPVNKLLLSAFDACSDSLTSDVSAVKLDAPPVLISDSPVFSFLQTDFKLSRVCFLCLMCLKFYRISQHFLFNSCPTILRVLSNANAAWASCRTSVLVQDALA